MAARSQTKIVNFALVKLGSSTTILSLEDGSPVAKVAAACWDSNVETVLADHPWNFALRRKAIGADAAAPAWGYAFAYTLPTDCLRWLPEDEDGQVFPGVLEGRKILTDLEAPLNIRYIANEIDPAVWSPGFIDALANRMAVDLALPVTGDTAIVGAREQIYRKSLPAAKRVDGMETVPEDRADGSYSWLDARQ